MKAFIALAALALSTQAHAAKVQPTKDEVKPSTVEHVFILQKESASQPAIRLVQVDNGGSSDISSLMMPSSLFMTIHQDGEMFDINANYLITNSAQDVRVLKFENGVATINFASKNDHLKEVKHTMKIDLRAALKESANANSDFGDDYSPKSAVTIDEVTR
jgi:hypothetical protein